jgi:hypothetical protein
LGNPHTQIKKVLEIQTQNPGIQTRNPKSIQNKKPGKPYKKSGTQTINEIKQRNEMNDKQRNEIFP